VSNIDQHVLGSFRWRPLCVANERALDRLTDDNEPFSDLALPLSRDSGVFPANVGGNGV